MSIQPPADLLSVLRANLRRIEEQHRDEDLTPDALELKQLLLRRIAKIEAAIGNINALIRKAVETTDTIQPAQEPGEKPNTGPPDVTPLFKQISTSQRRKPPISSLQRGEFQRFLSCWN
jgi:hypothetical protein